MAIEFNTTYGNGNFSVLPSADVKVYPAAYRDQTIDPKASLNLEENIIKAGYGKLGKESYIISWETSKLVCVIKGYYFEISNFAEADFNASEYNYANILLNEATLITNKDIKTPVLSPITSVTNITTNQTTGNDLCLDANNHFLGLAFSKNPLDRCISLNLKDPANRLNYINNDVHVADFKSIIFNTATTTEPSNVLAGNAVGAIGTYQSNSDGYNALRLLGRKDNTNYYTLDIGAIGATIDGISSGSGDHTYTNLLAVNEGSFIVNSLKTTINSSNTTVKGLIVSDTVNGDKFIVNSSKTTINSSNGLTVTNGLDISGINTGTTSGLVINGTKHISNDGYEPSIKFKTSNDTTTSWTVGVNCLNNTSDYFYFCYDKTGSALTQAAYIDLTGKLTASSFNALSDKRLKENITEYKTKKSILDLPIYKYDFINGQKDQIGCLAQDLQEICPEIVDTGADGYLSIKESKIVYLLLEEIKKLREDINKLKGE